MTRTAVIVCSTPRSGSSLLSSALWGTELCGQPAEYFETDIWQDLEEQWGARNHGEYLRRLVATTSTPNGVFGLKVHWHHMSTVHAFLQPHKRPSRRSKVNPFLPLAPQLHFVFLNRRDKVRQAVSMQRAILTQQWKEQPRDARPEAVLPEEIDLRALRSFAQTFERGEARWRAFFARARLTPLELTYEDDLEPGYEHAVLQILDTASIDRPQDLVVESDYQRQRDDWSEAIVQIYKDFERRGRLPR
jgi:LPS sulfotransferase NodH